MSGRVDWHPIVAEAARIAGSYTFAPTLRQVFYRLVSAGLIPNRHGAYKALSDRTAEARRKGTCPPFADGTRSIEIVPSWNDPADALKALAGQYRIDRWEHQESFVVVVLEKATLSVLARQVCDPYGIPVAALRGYGSQTLIDDLATLAARDGRPVEVIYVGDYDPTGLDIERDMLARLDVPAHVERVAVTAEQITRYGLVPLPAKPSDTRHARMVATEGRAMQVEAEAIDPAVLQTLIREAVERHADQDVHLTAMNREASDLAVLRNLAS